MPRRPSIGSHDNPLGRSRAAGHVLGAAFALVGLAACVSGPGASTPVSVPVGSIPVAAWPASPELLPAAPSGSAEERLTCASRTFPASGLEAPTGAERVSGPEFDALRAALKEYGPNFPGSADWTWRMAGRDDTGVIFLAQVSEPGAPGWVAIEVAADASGWHSLNMGQCDPHVVPSTEFGPATWAIDPAYAAPSPGSTELHLLVWELACSGGSPATGRMSAPVVEYAASTVTITIGVRPLGGGQTCPGPPGTPAIVRLPGPLGERTLLDGGHVPPAPPSPMF